MSKLVDVEVVKGSVAIQGHSDHYEKGDIIRGITEERARQIDSNFVKIIGKSSVKLDGPAEKKADVPPEEGLAMSAKDLVKGNNRDKLDKMAEELGIAPAGFPTKKAIAEAIVEARG